MTHYPTGTLRGCILTEIGWIAGQLRYDDRVLAIEGDPVRSPTPPYIVPGFVDLHIHGGGGADVMQGAAAIRQMARLHARHGTTSLLATTITAPVAEIDAALDGCRAAIEAPEPAAARVLGVHLEGPFINPDKLGAQPPFARPADIDLFHRWAARAPIKIVTFAPECDPDGALEHAIRAAGAKPQIGHSLCDYAAARAGIERGCGVTHLYNAMTGFAHRGNGIAGAALAHAGHAEVIADLIHVEPGAILAARRAIPNLYAVSDATAGAGMPDGDYQLGRHAVTKRNGAMRLDDGTLAGSALTLDQGLRNLVSIGLPLAEACRRVASIPAAWISRSDLGVLRPGTLADMVVLDGDLAVTQTFVSGQRVAGG